MPRKRKEGTTPRQVWDTEYFIQKAREIHGDKFDYSKTVYVKSALKVIIICKKHGEFLQTPNGHLQGDGCNKCSREESGRLRSLSLDSFYEKAKAKFGDKFTYEIPYSDDEFRNDSIIKITCPIHGIFETKAGGHLRTANGCNLCGCAITGLKKITPLATFIEKANIIHNSKYDYSQVEWIDTRVKIKVICPEHGAFEVLPISHISKKRTGCWECGKIAIGNALRSNRDDFISNAVEVHGDKYDYSKVIYTGCDNGVEIRCKIHGIFTQTPYSHTRQKHGCPECAKEKSRIPILDRYKGIPTIFYSFKYNDKYKIGITTQNTLKRYSGEFPLENMEELFEYTFDTFEQAYMFEQFMLNRYYEYRYRGKKIFKNTGNSEVFKKDILKMYLDEGGNIGDN